MRSLNVDTQDEQYTQIQNDQLEEVSEILDSHHLQEEVPQIQNDQLEEVSGILDSQEDQYYEMQQEETSKLLTAISTQYNQHLYVDISMELKFFPKFFDSLCVILCILHEVL